MNVKEIMTKNVELLDINATVLDAARRMKQLNVGALPIRKGDRLAGMVTDRDIVLRAIADGHDLKQCSVNQIMSSPISYAFEDQPVEEVAKLMHDKRIRRLPILSRKKRLVGVVSLGDLTRVENATHAACKALEGVSASA